MQLPHKYYKTTLNPIINRHEFRIKLCKSLCFRNSTCIIAPVVRIDADMISYGVNILRCVVNCDTYVLYYVTSKVPACVSNHKTNISGVTIITFTRDNISLMQELHATSKKLFTPAVRGRDCEKTA